jgi:dihydroorotate dehydrogenase
VIAANSRSLPLFLKVAPDLTDQEIRDIVGVAMDAGIAAIIATNTTLSREGLRSWRRKEAGGLSGAPLFEKSTRVLAKFYQATEGRLPLIGVGGIASAADIETKLRAGASAVQLYSALSYKGLSLVPKMLRELDARIAAEGGALTDWTGSAHEDWLSPEPKATPTR